MRAGGAEAGTLTTRPVTFDGARLFVNAACDGGELRVDVLDASGRVVPGFSAAEAKPVSGDSTRAAVTWKSGGDLSRLAHTPVKFRFALTRGRLYSFWTAKDEHGASAGYLAAGGLGHDGPTDDHGDLAEPTR